MILARSSVEAGWSRLDRRQAAYSDLKSCHSEWLGSAVIGASPVKRVEAFPSEMPMKGRSHGVHRDG
jgi:hypothetical protein